ncbi:MAG TPA: hypothetical protein VLB27_05475, partial [candidate division Zixibacteria bacterium]|nr:hypothetical protein [candidate division Zixibacteria bacterium]
YTYFANFRASNGKPLVVVDQLDPTRWTSIGAASGITDTFTISIDQFNGLVAIASEKTGIYRVDPGPDPFDLNDYQVTHFTENAADPRLRLPTDEINVIRFDRFGDLWAGSRFGLARYDAGIERFVEVVLPLTLGPEVSDLAFDPQDNLWIATPTGLGWFNRAAGEFTVLTTLNSGLVSNNINALAFDARINHLWIATDNGVSRFRPNIGQANFKLDEVTAYPNPFVITYGAEILHLNYSGVAQWRIFTESGELVWVGASNAGWTGVNQSGAAVASGVYLFTLTVDGTETGVGKFALIQNR